MLRAVLVFGVCACLFATVLGAATGYDTPDKLLAIRMYEATLAACYDQAHVNHWMRNGNSPVSAAIDFNHGPLKLGSDHLKTSYTLFTGTSDRGMPPEFRPHVQGIVIADATDGSITISFANGHDMTYVQLYQGGPPESSAQQTEFCPSTSSPPGSPNTTISGINSKNPTNYMILRDGHNAGGPCLKCHINHGFKMAWRLVRNRVQKIVHDYAVKGFYGPIFVSGFSLGGALAVLAGIQMNIDYENRAAATYVFGAPKVGLRDCSQQVKILKMSLFRVTWPDDPFPLQPINCNADQWEHLGVELFYPKTGGPITCPPNQSCLKEQLSAEFRTKCFHPVHWLIAAMCVSMHSANTFGKMNMVTARGPDNRYLKCTCKDGKCTPETCPSGKCGDTGASTSGGASSSKNPDGSGGTSGGAGTSNSPRGKGAGPSMYELHLLEHLRLAAYGNTSSSGSGIEKWQLLAE